MLNARCGYLGQAGCYTISIAVRQRTVYDTIMISPPLKVWVCLAFVCLGVASGHATTWYAAADGTSTNGTLALPWSVPFSVTNGNSFLQPGDTVLFKSGTFVCTESVSNNYEVAGPVLEFRKSGTPSAKITYQSETLWGFSFDGGVLLNTCTNLVIRNFHIFYSGATDRNKTNSYILPFGINVNFPGNDILHNLIENTGHPGIGSWGGTKGKYIAGNIIRFIGENDWTYQDTYSGGERGSGMYLQNQSDNSSDALIQGNISYFNYTTGMKAYGTGAVWGFNFHNNIIFVPKDEVGIFYDQDQINSQGVKMLENYVWSTGNPLMLGYSLGNANPSNAIIAGNYAVSTYQDGVLSVDDGWLHITVTNNTFVNTTYHGLVQMEMTGQTNFLRTHNWDYNSYHAGNSLAYGDWTFEVAAVYTNFSYWTNIINGDTHSTIVTSAPTATVSFAFAPSYDSNFVHVAVFNWQSNATTTVDLSSYFNVGNALRIYDAQNIPIAYTNFIYAGGTVALDLTRTNIATMLGTFALHSTNVWSGFDPRFRAFVIYRNASRLQPPSNFHVSQ